MNKRYLSTGVGVVLMIAWFVQPLSARDKNQHLARPLGNPGLNTHIVHKIGKLWNAGSNYGQYGDPNVPSGLPSMEWPGGSGTHHLWEGRFWIGANVDGEKRVSHCDYGNYEFAANEDHPQIDVGPGKSVEDSYAIFDDLNTSLASTTSLGVIVQERTLSWSTKDFDDFLIYEYNVIRAEDGDDYSGKALNDVYVSWVYDCDIGTGTDPTSPHIDDLVDYDGWDGNNPIQYQNYKTDIVHNLDWNGDGVWDAAEGYDSRGIPIGWEHAGSPSITNPNYDPNGIQPDGFYDEYQVWLRDDGPVIRWQTSVTFNYNGETIQTVAGEPAVIDGDTLHGFVIPRNMSIMYDGDDPTTPELDTGEQGKVPGFAGGRLIYTDYFKMYGAYNETEDDTLMRVYSHQWWNWESDPGSDRDKYNYMAATHTASAGNHFMPHPFAIGAPTFDYRWMTTTGPFQDFRKGDTLRFVYAAIVGYGLAGLRENADNAFIAYYTGSHGDPYNPTGPEEDQHYLLPVPPPVPVLKYSPLNHGVKLSWDNSAELAPDPLIGVPDFEGYRVYRSAYRPGNWELLAVFDNTTDYRYLIDFETGDTLSRDANGKAIMVDLPKLTHQYIDQGDTMWATDTSGARIPLWVNVAPTNDLPYYYVVTSYDNPAVHGRPEFPSIECSRVNFAVDADGAPKPIFPEGMYEGSDTGPSELQVSVYPNPYIGANRLEKEYESKITFVNLPPDCRITIFSLSGDMIDVIAHNDGTTDHDWDLVSRNNQEVSSGLYVYIVETKDGRRQVGKFVILRGE